MTAMLILALAAISPAELETAGRLPEAGAAWESAQSVQGQARIMCRMLEEALYAGDGERAVLLMGELEPVCEDTALVDFWMARAAWSAGLSSLAAEEMDGIRSSDPWLSHRAAGLAALYRQQGEGAVDELLKSLAAGGTARRRFWSAIDLCCAYLETGMYQEALALSELLLYNYRGDALAPVMYGLCLHASGRYSEASSVLSGVNGSDPAAESIARALMEGFEQ